MQHFQFQQQIQQQEKCSQTSIHVHYGNNFLQPTSTNSASINDIITELYNNIFFLNLDLSEICIVYYYMGFPITKFRVGFCKGLVFYNDENYLRVSSISPQHIAIDLAYTKMRDSCGKKSAMPNVQKMVDKLNCQTNTHSEKISTIYNCLDDTISESESE